MVQKYIIDKTDLPKLIRGEELALAQGSKYRAFCIEINEKLTNGDVIRAAFPKAEVIEKRAVVMVGISRMIVFDLDWWNAPYKE